MVDRKEVTWVLHYWVSVTVSLGSPSSLCTVLLPGNALELDDT